MIKNNAILSFKLPRAMKEDLDKAAKELNIPRSRFVRELISERLLHRLRRLSDLPPPNSKKPRRLREIVAPRLLGCRDGERPE